MNLSINCGQYSAQGFKLQYNYCGNYIKYVGKDQMYGFDGFIV